MGNYPICEVVLSICFYSSVSIWLTVFTQIVLMGFYFYSSEAYFPQLFITCRVQKTWGVGYSCVLFGLMTYSVIQMRGSCPIRLFGICFPTFHLPLGFVRYEVVNDDK